MPRVRPALSITIPGRCRKQLGRDQTGTANRVDPPYAAEAAQGEWQPVARIYLADPVSAGIE